MDPNTRSSSHPAGWRPVLYLDLDNTLLSWCSGKPEAAAGAHAFLLWALEQYEVRWLTRWCRNGEMAEDLLLDLCKMLRVPPRVVRDIRGAGWEDTDSKLNGIFWLEHLVLGRPFLWLEDELGVGERELRFLDDHGWRSSYRHCNVTQESDALLRVHRELREADEDAAQATPAVPPARLSPAPPNGTKTTS